MKEGVLSAALCNLQAVINQIGIWQCLFLRKICEIMTPYLCQGSVSKPFMYTPVQGTVWERAEKVAVGGQRYTWV